MWSLRLAPTQQSPQSSSQSCPHLPVRINPKIQPEVTAIFCLLARDDSGMATPAGDNLNCRRLSPRGAPKSDHLFLCRQGTLEFGQELHSRNQSWPHPRIAPLIIEAELHDWRIKVHTRICLAFSYGLEQLPNSPKLITHTAHGTDSGSRPSSREVPGQGLVKEWRSSTDGARRRLKSWLKQLVCSSTVAVQLAVLHQH